MGMDITADPAEHEVRKDDETPPRDSRVENSAPGTPTEPTITRRRGRDTEVSHTQTPLSRNELCQRTRMGKISTTRLTKFGSPLWNGNRNSYGDTGTLRNGKEMS
ncbi:unnamed protein product, partial [Agarophyton chilense]